MIINKTTATCNTFKQKITLPILLCFLGITMSQGQEKWMIKKDVVLDSIRLSDPFILADKKTKMYYMTGTGGMLWTSWIYDVYVQGVAYSESGKLDGPWIQEKEPITPLNFGHGMLFETLEGKWLMAIHSHKEINGKYHRVPHLFDIDLSGEKLVVGKLYIP